MSLLNDVILGSYDYPNSSSVNYGQFSYTVNPFVVNGTVETTLLVGNSVNYSAWSVSFNANSVTLTMVPAPNSDVFYSADPFNGPVFTVLSGDSFGSVTGMVVNNPDCVPCNSITAYVLGNSLFINWEGAGGMVGDSITIDFAPVPPVPPTVEPDRAHVSVAGAVTANAADGVLANDTDPIPNDALTVSAVDGQTANVGHALAGSYGTLTLNADGSYSYSANHGGLPRPSGVGIDTFSYTAIDGAGGTATSTLTLVVTSPGQHYVGGTGGTTIQGGFGIYVLDGGTGNDTLIAGTGIQTLIGGPNDTLKAAFGIDTFVFAPNFGTNTITNFNPLFDALQLPKSEFANLAAVQAASHQVGANTVITYDAADTITLTGVSLSHLHFDASHFLLA
jgi:VCBS repeat-containing protein